MSAAWDPTVPALLSPAQPGPRTWTSHEDRRLLCATRFERGRWGQAEWDRFEQLEAQRAAVSQRARALTNEALLERIETLERRLADAGIL